MTESRTKEGLPAFRQRPETYLGDARATDDKDIFRLLLRMLEAAGHDGQGSILDVGCATGALLAFLARRYPASRLTGVDIDHALVRAARARPELAGADLIVADGLEARLGLFDVVTSFGMLGIFDQFEPLLENLLANTAPGGLVFIQGLLNPDDIDVRIAYRDHCNQLDWMRGFNIFSRERVARWLSNRGLACRFVDFHMTASLPRREALPHRAHTIDLVDGTRRTTNGLCLLLPETLLEISVPA